MNALIIIGLVVWYALGGVAEWNLMCDSIKLGMKEAYICMFFFPVLGPLLFIANKFDTGNWMGKE